MTRRTTAYLEPDVHRALRLKAVAADRPISHMVSAALKQALAEDAADLEAFEKRQKEPSIDFEDFVKALRRRSKL